MRRGRIILLVLLLFACTVFPAQGRRHAHSGPATGAEQEVLRDFEQILDLWRDGRYAELYEHTFGGKEGKETFAKRLEAAPRKPACCWEKMQDARVTLKSGRAATVHAKLGFEGNVSGTEFVTKPVKLKREAGSAWLISESELFSLAQLGKKRARYKYLPSQPR